jgi:competence protein ComEC
MAWAVLSGHMRLAHTLPEGMDGGDMTVQGVVQSIPEPRRRSTRFEFLITSGPEALALPFPVRLSWYRSKDSPVPALHAGQRWQLRIRLKPPHGLQNPGGFDYETWLFSRGIRATGYIRAEGDNRQLDGMDWRYAVPRSREFLLNRLKPLTADTEHGALLLALALGYRGAISDAQWDRLTGTGTNHLMAISGLHIGLVAGLLYAATLFGLRQWRRRAGAPRRC